MLRYFIISNRYYKVYMSEYYKNNLEKFREYYLANRDLIIKKSIDYYYTNKVAIRQRQNKYYEKNKDRINAKRKKMSGIINCKIPYGQQPPAGLQVTF